MSFTYTTLKQAIQDWTENDETTFVSNLDVFIKNTEERILKLVELEYFRKNVTGTLTNGNKFLAVPADYLGSIALSVVNSSSNEFLLFKDVNFVQEFNPNPATTGVPRYYAYFDVDNFIVGPTPNSNYAVELHYYYRPTSITATGDGTSWLGTNAPDALLFGSLYESYIFMKGEAEFLKIYNDRFIEALSRLKNYGEATENTDAYRTGVRIMQKT
tara:strand:- start:1501 stop:2145 length:645 start_codon:yes stop_codon:yes gene_type:complete